MAPVYSDATASATHSQPGIAGSAATHGAREIPLSQGKVALVDEEDYEAVSAFKWHAHRHKGIWYADRYIRKADGRLSQRGLHQFILQPPPDLYVDHADGDGLNNQRSNLRLATRSENSQNQRRRTREGRCASRFRGVAWDRERRLWRSKICVNGRDLHLGRFADEHAAALAYDAAARLHFGVFASPNFPVGDAS